MFHYLDLTAFFSALVFVSLAILASTVLLYLSSPAYSSAATIASATPPFLSFLSLEPLVLISAAFFAFSSSWR